MTTEELESAVNGANGDDEFAYDAGYEAFRSGAANPFVDATLCKAWLDGKHDAERASRVRVVMPARPEGYFHSPISTFN